VPEGDRDAQPSDFKPGGELPFVVYRAQDVVIALYGIKDALKTGAIPVTDNFTPQNVQFVQITLALAKVLPATRYPASGRGWMRPSLNIRF